MYKHNDEISLHTRKTWCRQAVESIVYIHGHGVLHSDLRPDNFLIHETTTASLELWLCDFGGSTCDKLGLDGGSLPDSGFYDPNAEQISSLGTDLFSLGSVLYTIITGHWPYRGQGDFQTGDELERYRENVDLFGRRIYPETNELFAGKTIVGCWTSAFEKADEASESLNNDIGM